MTIICKESTRLSHFKSYLMLFVYVFLHITRGTVRIIIAKNLETARKQLSQSTGRYAEFNLHTSFPCTDGSSTVIYQ